jgi:hypothetical protein
VNIDVVLTSTTSSKKWLESADGKAVIQFLTEWQDSALKTLATAEGLAAARAQGEFKVLSRILGLPEEIRQYQENVRKKKVSPVTGGSRTGLVLK